MKKDYSTSNKVLRKLIDIFKTQKAIAHAYGINQHAVSKWFTQNMIPLKRAHHTEKITKGKIKALDVVNQKRN